MGKIVVCADHPSNDFFRAFPNCYIYKTPQEFVEKVQKAMASEPEPLSPELQHLLSWEAATDRFIDSADLDRLPPRGLKRGDIKKTAVVGEDLHKNYISNGLICLCWQLVGDFCGALSVATHSIILMYTSLGGIAISYECHFSYQSLHFRRGVGEENNDTIFDNTRPGERS